MKLLIHSLDKEEWDRIKDKYDGWEVISDEGKIRPCVGCFGCWVKTPGECVIKDGYDRMGALIHKADEVVVMSRYTYGGFDSFVKNVFDRCIGWVLPYFELINGEMHHKKRYPEDKPLTFVFRGSGLTDEDKAAAKQYVKAVCTNLHGSIRDVRFEDCAASNDEVCAAEIENRYGGTILLNCSLRGQKANSKLFLDRFGKYIEGEKRSIDLVSYLNKQDELTDILLAADRIVLGMPLYVDGIPSAVLRIMERLEKCGRDSDKKIYAVANMGFYESAQIRNLMWMVRAWCNSCGYVYGGGLAIGAGEMMGQMMKMNSIEKGPTKNVAAGMEKLSRAVNESGRTEDIYADVNRFPRAFYMSMANMSWSHGIGKNGLKRKDLLRKCK